ncbi:MAG: hypothetical protein AAGA77_16485 [Bacteroidota bacterium]
MRIYSLSKVLAAPVVTALIIILFLQYNEGYNMGFWFVLPVVITVVLYISHEEIDFWYLQRNPIQLDQEIINLLNKYVPFYRGLNIEDKIKYHNRLSQYITGRSFKSVGSSEMKNVPYDVKAMISTSAVQLAFYMDDYLIGDFDRIFVYKHPFGSPRHKFLHTVETEAEDGVIIYSLEQLIPGITNPKMYYNIGMHGYVDAFIKANPTAPSPPRLGADWMDILGISGLTKRQILATIGYDSADLLVVLGTCYFTYPEAFDKRLPELKKELDILFEKSKI